MTRVVIATGSFGGPATYSKLLAEKLPAYDYEVKVVSFDEVLKYPKVVRHLTYFFKLFFKSFNADIIYAQDPVSVGLPAIFAAKIAGARFFLKIVGDYAWEQGVLRFDVKDQLDDFVAKNNYHLAVRFLRYVERFVANRAEKIIVPSKYLKGVVGKWGIDKDKISVIYNAFVKPEIIATKEELKRKFGFKYPTIISIGRLVPWKGFPILIKATEILKKEFPKIELYIIDDGPDKEFLVKMAGDLKIKSDVVFVGRMPQNEVYEYLKAADVFALVSSYEGFSHLLLETLAIGTPVVTTPVGGNVEIIKNGENGLFVPFGHAAKTAEAIGKILHDKEFALRLVANGRLAVSGFTEESMLHKLSLVLR
ncbi:MAG: glycosyltransferase family 4 protein [bacterium]|nr:glycosyltransferase family 4 protein [bacterium]